MTLMRTSLLLALSVGAALAAPVTGRIVVSPNHRFLQYEDVIQFSLVHTPHMKTVDGAPALTDGSPAKPDLRPNGYWDHVDWVLDQAARRGLWLAMLPSWGSLVKTGVLNAGNAAAYAAFLAH